MQSCDFDFDIAARFTPYTERALIVDIPRWDGSTSAIPADQVALAARDYPSPPVRTGLPDF